MLMQKLEHRQHPDHDAIKIDVLVLVDPYSVFFLFLPSFGYKDYVIGGICSPSDCSLDSRNPYSTSFVWSAKSQKRLLLQ